MKPGSQAGREALAALPEWDLAPVAPPAGVPAAIEAVLAACREFSASHCGVVGTLDAQALAVLLDKLGAIRNQLLRLASYAAMRHALDVRGEEEQHLVAEVDECLLEATELLRCFELEWMRLPALATDPLLADPALHRDRHFLRSLRRYRPHVLPEREEHALACREAAASEAWRDLYDAIVSGLAVEIDGASLPVDQALDHLRDGRPEVRRQVHPAVERAVGPHLDVLARCYDSLVADRLAVDGLRGFSNPRQPADLENELRAAIVDRALVAVEASSSAAADWFVRKAKVLGCDRLEHADQHSPALGQRTMSYREAVAAVATAVAEIDPMLREIVERFDREGRVDARPRPEKSIAVRCISVAQDSPPYIQMRFGGRAADILGLAHELGHGIGFTLSAAAQTPLSYEPPPFLSEVAATLTELLVGEHLVETAASPEERDALVSLRADKAFDVLHRQVAITRFEQRAYAARASGWPLTAARLGDLWLAAMSAHMSPAIAIDPASRVGWALVPHVFHGRFYNYTYAMAFLVGLSLLRSWRSDRARFGRDYLRFLARGASAPPEEQLAGLGLDLATTDWSAALSELRRMIGAGDGAGRASRDG
ncbi:MAG TPA: M3 family metallopeptidase [Candidatus Dormibacteraeota bacterium]